MWNRCYEISSGDIVMHCGDDIRFRTKGWDTKVLNKFKEYKDKIVLVYGDDGIRNYYGQYVIVEGLNGRKEVGKLIRMNGKGKGVPRSIILEGDDGSTSQWVSIKSVTHPDERIGEI